MFLQLINFGFVAAALYAFYRVNIHHKKLDEIDAKIEQLQKLLFKLMEEKEACSAAKQEPSNLHEDVGPVEASRDPAPYLELDDMFPEIEVTTTETEVGSSSPFCDTECESGYIPAGKTDTETEADLLTKIKESWMVWLGGACVGLAGIFMVKYSIDQGLLGPVARVSITLIVGVLLHILAEILRRKTGHHTALAALCGGASITLFAALLAALHLYQIVSPIPVFIALAVVSLATMLLAVLHGPILAILGLLSAYSVPILVNTGSDNIEGALVYAAIISLSGHLLIRYVKSLWLWNSTVLLSFLWAFIGIFTPRTEPLAVTLYLVVLGYMLLAIPNRDWLLSHTTNYPSKHPLKRFYSFEDQNDRLFYAMVGLLILQALNLQQLPLSHNWLFIAPMLPVFVLVAIRVKSDFVALPWLSLIGCLLPLFSQFVVFDPMVTLVPALPEEQSIVLQLFGILVISYSGLGAFLGKKSRYRSFFVSLAATTPVILLALCYLLLPATRENLLFPVLSVCTGIGLVSLAYQSLLSKFDKSAVLSLLVAGHLAIALTAVYLFDEASLTLALSTELILLAFTRKLFDAPELDWLIKCIVGLVVVRLTCNPFLLQYSPESHWSLWTYGGSALCAAISCRLLPAGKKIRCWLEGATLHLALLFFASELRYQLYDGEIFRREYSSLEAAINTIVWASAGLIYFKRAGLSQTFFSGFYILIGRLLLVIAAANHVFFSLLVYNPLLSRQTFSETPLFNLLLIAYGLPIIPIVLANTMNVLNQKKALAIAAGFSFMFFISIEIRHIFTPQLFVGLGADSAEIYTYSFAWLVAAVAGIISGARWQKKAIYQGGMVTLLVLVAKIFFIDMAELEGLYRVASFMGLGMTLLSIAFLHKWLRFGNDTINPKVVKTDEA